MPFTLRLPPELDEFLIADAKAMKRSKTGHILSILENWCAFRRAGTLTPVLPFPTVEAGSSARPAKKRKNTQQTQDTDAA